jgi:hypothetical protein
MCLPLSAFLLHVPFSEAVSGITEMQLVAMMQHKMTTLMGQNISVIALAKFAVLPHLVITN